MPPTVLLWISTDVDESVLNETQLNAFLEQLHPAVERVLNVRLSSVAQTAPVWQGHDIEVYIVAPVMTPAPNILPCDEAASLIVRECCTWLKLHGFQDKVTVGVTLATVPLWTASSQD